MYCVGIISTVIIVPWYSDRIGRRWLSLLSYYVLMIAMFGILMAHDLIWLYIFAFVAGSTFPGRTIVALNWLLEY